MKRYWASWIGPPPPFPHSSGLDTRWALVEAADPSEAERLLRLICPNLLGIKHMREVPPDWGGPDERFPECVPVDLADFERRMRLRGGRLF